MVRNDLRRKIDQEMALQKLCFRVFPTASRKMSSMPTNSNKPYTVIVEGNIGSGKTTFLQPFMKHKNLVEVCPEPVEKWQNLQVCSYILDTNLISTK